LGAPARGSTDASACPAEAAEELLEKADGSTSPPSRAEEEQRAWRQAGLRDSASRAGAKDLRLRRWSAARQVRYVRLEASSVQGTRAEHTAAVALDAPATGRSECLAAEERQAQPAHCEEARDLPEAAQGLCVRPLPQEAEAAAVLRESGPAWVRAALAWMESEFPAARQERQRASPAVERLVATRPMAAAAARQDEPAPPAFRPFPLRSSPARLQW
jgi:hypothetical protein